MSERDYNVHDSGDLVKLTVEFTEGADYVDPPTVACKVKHENGAATTYTYGTDVNLVRTATGRYECYISPEQLGVWYYRWQATDGAAIQTRKAGAEEGRFVVRRSNFG